MGGRMMGSIVIRHEGKTGSLHEGETLLAHIQRLGSLMAARCGGKGECGACVVRVDAPPGVLSPLSPAEEERGLPPGCRLACQATVIDETAEITVTPVAPHQFRILTDGQAAPGSGEAGERMGGREGGVFGLAFDAGTTTLVLRWYDLTNPGSGPVHTEARINPQVVYGDNVIDRVAYARVSPENERRLRCVLLDALAEMVSHGPVPGDAISTVVVVGNSVMRDTVMGLPLAGFGVYPFSSVSPGALEVPARELGLPVLAGAVVYAPPVLGHFVGADLLAVIIATGMHRSVVPLLAIDIGTNTEIAAGSAERILVTSCASGPAFEGAGIRSGTGAVPGAVSAVTLTETGQLKVETIDNLPARGICGSGMIDALAIMRRAGVIDQSGRFGHGQREFVIQEGPPRIALSASDTDALLLAKAAILTGARVLLEKADIPLSRLTKCFMAGAFGSSIDLGNARAIGLIPPVPNDRVSRIGNASVEGAALLLCYPALRREAEAVIPRITHISLEALPDFLDRFCEALYFGEKPSS